MAVRLGAERRPPFRWTASQSFPALIGTAIVVRLLMLPLSHTWDGQTWVNTFAQLAAPGNVLEVLRRPYETTRELSLLTQAAGHQSDFYESWAYPPLMLYVYWPLARLYGVLGGHLAATFPVQPTFYASSVPVQLLALVRLPNLLADAGTLILMRRLGVTLRELRWYAFNPLVLLATVWTFDSVMVFWLLLALVAAERKHWGWAGIAIAAGAATKYVPLAVLPALVIAILGAGAGRRDACSNYHARARLLDHALAIVGSNYRRVCAGPQADRDAGSYDTASWRSRLSSLALLLTTTTATLAALLAPVLDGVRYVVETQSARFGSGLTFEQLWRAWAQQLPYEDWQPRWQLYASAMLGNMLLPLALLAATWLVIRRPMPLVPAFTILVLAFLIGSKLVNEAYVLAPIALMTVQLVRQPSDVLRGLRTLLWALAFGYAAINTPLPAFFFSMVQQVWPGTTGAISHWTDAYRVFLSYPESVWPFALFGLAFSLTAAAAVWQIVRNSANETGQEVIGARQRLAPAGLRESLGGGLA